MSKKDLDDLSADIVAQDIYSLDLGYGAVPPDYSSTSYSSGIDTITIDSSTMNSMYSGTITLPSTSISNGGFAIGGAGYTIGSAGSNYNWTTSTGNSTVNIDNDGIDMAAGTDIKIDGKSLKSFMNKMEERLAILVPDPAKLEKFQALKKAYEHYKTMESLCFDEPKQED